MSRCSGVTTQSLSTMFHNRSSISLCFFGANNAGKSWAKMVLVMLSSATASSSWLALIQRGLALMVATAEARKPRTALPRSSSGGGLFLKLAMYFLMPRRRCFALVWRIFFLYCSCSVVAGRPLPPLLSLRLFDASPLGEVRASSSSGRQSQSLAQSASLISTMPTGTGVFGKCNCPSLSNCRRETSWPLSVTIMLANFPPPPLPASAAFSPPSLSLSFSPTSSLVSTRV
mmetsp:Transcript_13690/g.54177  ORF Transcript_13690/g.54177 Transcript_13690/m.54177 type:complete len:230 (+) Transcript_13690:1036-1725(+)